MATDSELLTISQIVARYPGSRGARRIHPATVTRWILAGCPNRAGARVKLAATRAGSRWLVRESDLQAFFSALGAEAEPGASVPPDATPARTPAARARATEKAVAALKKMGA
ncbi:MAG: helix-turn-helix domain-containing protein [Gemmataceae bacterium]|nr:helix-turn-helix domain-containing protein [Gemmataceae bacterium]